MKTSFSVYDGPTCAAIAQLTAYGAGMMITRIYVLPGFRGRGFGSQVLQDVLQEADHTNTRLYLEVGSEDGLPADELQAWYERHGFSLWRGIYRRNPR